MVMPACAHGQPLTDTLARRHAHQHVLFVTFSNAATSELAANWAQQLRTIGFDGLVGANEELPAQYTRKISLAGSGIFCCTGKLMKRNGQAGRWEEVAPLLRFGLHVLISDADVSWLRDPRPYFREVRRRHPALDFLLCSDRAFNGYVTEPLVRRRNRTRGDFDARARPASAHEQALSGDLDLEVGSEAAIPSYNIGILMLYAHAAANLSSMIDVLWVEAVSTPTTNNRGKQEPMHAGLAAWDQVSR